MYTGLSSETVDRAYAAMKARAFGAIDAIVKRKTLLGWAFGNNTQADSDAGAIRLLLGIDSDGNDLANHDNHALPRWQFAGYDAVCDDSKIDSWLATGKIIESSIAAIDGYADGATLTSTVQLTIKKTVDDTAKVAENAVGTVADFAWKALPWYVWGGLAVAGFGVVYFKVIRK